MDVRCRGAADIADRVATRRQELGLTQDEVAKQAGVSRHLVSDVENGRCSSIGVGNLMNIAAALGLWVTLAPGIPVSPSNSAALDDEQIRQFMDKYYPEGLV